MGTRHRIYSLLCSSSTAGYLLKGVIMRRFIFAALAAINLFMQSNFSAIAEELVLPPEAAAHIKAAQHLEESAFHHRQAAKYIVEKNENKIHEHMALAQGEHLKAVDDIEAASKLHVSADDARNTPPPEIQRILNTKPSSATTK